MKFSVSELSLWDTQQLFALGSFPNGEISMTVVYHNHSTQELPSRKNVEMILLGTKLCPSKSLTVQTSSPVPQNVTILDAGPLESQLRQDELM